MLSFVAVVLVCLVAVRATYIYPMGTRGYRTTVTTDNCQGGNCMPNCVGPYCGNVVDPCANGACMPNCVGPYCNNAVDPCANGACMPNCVGPYCGNTVDPCANGACMPNCVGPYCNNVVDPCANGACMPNCVGPQCVNGVNPYRQYDLGDMMTNRIYGYRNQGTATGSLSRVILSGRRTGSTTGLSTMLNGRSVRPSASKVYVG